jgi:hypothetical protein
MPPWLIHAKKDELRNTCSSNSLPAASAERRAASFSLFSQRMMTFEPPLLQTPSSLLFFSPRCTKRCAQGKWRMSITASGVALQHTLYVASLLIYVLHRHYSCILSYAAAPLFVCTKEIYLGCSIFSSIEKIKRTPCCFVILYAFYGIKLFSCDSCL